ncbi:hypothetical protein [Nocardioides ferulae]|uniref:hypothetical protein n=1 Tax=Nocardioides ferulae TaxID=2340821 RepID=UPI000EAD7510|nr:hypothetical protein [Nocardioides ferulae]
MNRPHDPSDPTPSTHPARPPGRPGDLPLGPGEETEVRRLLAAARHTEPMPETVVDRLDGVLARLTAGDDPDLETPGGIGSSGRSGTVVQLASRRRRARRLLLVAAAAVVAGVGAGQLVSEVPSADNDDSAASAEAEPLSSGDTFPLEDQAGGRSRAQRDATAFKGMAPAPIGSETFADDVAALQLPPVETSAGMAGSSTDSEGGGRGQYDSQRSDGGPAADLSTDAAWFECTPADWGAGRLVPVLYDGDPAVLAFRPRTGDSRVVELLQCGSGDVLRSLTVPTR